MHSKDRDVAKTPTELSRYDTNKSSSFHSEEREWNKDGEVSWAVLSTWCSACNKEYGEELDKGASRILYITAMLRQHWIMAGEENRTPRGRAEAMEVIRQARTRFDGQYYDELRIYNIAENEFSHINKLERALGEHMTKNKETMVRQEDRFGAFISEQQSKIDSGQAYESAYALNRDPENHPAYGPANYQASNPPSTPTSVSADKCPSTYLGERRSQPSSLHSSHNSHKSALKEGQSKDARSNDSGKAHSQPMRAQSAFEIPRSHSSIRARRRFDSDLEHRRASCTKSSVRSFSLSNF
ncbi:uncharacterized protein Bfra_006689 [Botrytis fragariae]|uniref:Uncharacterized protein n=1 Tax=Botrytis fragariae TaxID=1964551 RepID=A0A8H6EP35_9HELO|nr:uncharacterized protein Bfra_006689 [Botrytis fragariae]KAF5879481.1 hypothetical protein Bfra_006689 [Botrytis fragariae]